MSRLKQDLLIRFVKIVNVVLITVPFAICWFYYYSSNVAGPFYKIENWVIVALFFILYIIFGRIYGAFMVSIKENSELIYSQTLSIIVSDIIMFIIICLLIKHFPNILPGIIAFASQIVLTTIWTLNISRWYFQAFPAQATAIVYEDRKELVELIDTYLLNKKYDIQRTVTVCDCIANLALLDGMKTVFLSYVHSHNRDSIIKYCINNNINVFIVPIIGDILMTAAHPQYLFHFPMLHVGRYMARPEDLFMKRVLDIVISGIALIMSSPIFFITAIAIKFDGGPVFYKQVRLTKDGKEFNIIKFRSMRVDAEKDGVARLSTGKNDERVTSVGKIIRRVRIDELPQLLLVLIGTMSIVGPRPERPEIAAEYEKYLPEFVLRLQVKAGLTGYAQVYGKYNTAPYDKLKMDLMYIAHLSIVEDLKIMFATIKILFIPNSTEGINDGMTTALDKEPQIENKDG